jgi:hypothetical protein
MSDSTIVLAQLFAEGCTAELYLNGAPISRLSNPEINTENTVAEQWLIPGLNTIEVLINPGEHPSIARSDVKNVDYDAPMKATGRLIRFPDGADGRVESGTVLAEANFVWEAGNPNRMQLPASVSASTELGNAHGAWAWQSCPVLTLDEALIEEARQVMDSLESAIRGGHADQLFRLTEIQNRECMRALPAWSEDMVRAEFANMVATFKDAGNEAFPKRDPANHDFRLVCGGRLVELIDKDFQASFRLKNPDSGYVLFMNTFLGRVGKELRVIRS